ncbi:MAG: hydrogenase maturation protease [Sedimentisphaerales bacterium]|nr:hydrogenase maturation protease [Sedimentisphaerales bacterium]
MGLIRAMLEQCRQRKCLLVGIGNILQSDDGFGPYVIENLRGKTSVSLLDGGSSPENMLGPILKISPDELIIVDTLCLDAPVGTLHWVEPDELENVGISTHAPSLDIFVSYIKQHNYDTRIHIIGVVPAQITFGEDISRKVRQSAEELIVIISNIFPAPP